MGEKQAGEKHDDFATFFFILLLKCKENREVVTSDLARVRMWFLVWHARMGEGIGEM